MPLRRKNKKRKWVAAAEGDEDRISDLHDDLLRHVLSFLPAHEAVRTCVLSSRWREVWKFTRVLRFTKAETWRSPARFNKFVNDMLSFRDLTPLDEFVFKTYLFMPQIMSDAFNDSEEPVRYAKAWIQYALMRDVQVLKVLVNSRHITWLLNTPLISHNLRTLVLKTVVLDGCSTDFSGCPALEDLKVRDCQILVPKISSQSLRRLRINTCEFSTETCTQIVTPKILSLRLDARKGRVPLFQRMPLLVTAYVRLGDYSRDRCWHSNFGQCGSDACVDCYGNPYGSDSCVLLRSLSNATDLELAAELRSPHHGVAIFKKDMQSAPTFSKLKTLVLHGWVIASEVHTLIPFLRHAPVLEKISIRLYEEQEYITEIEESYRLLEEQLLPSHHLKIIEVSCTSGHFGRVDKLVKFLDNSSTMVQAELLASIHEDSPVSESEMILQRRLHHQGAKASEHFVIKWSSGPPASLAIWESYPGPLHLLYRPPVTAQGTENSQVKQSSKRIRKPNSRYPESLWVK